MVNFSIVAVSWGQLVSADVSCDVSVINLFINSNAILNRDALWSIQGKNHHVNAAIVRGIRRTGKILR